MKVFITGANGRLGRMLRDIWSAGPQPHFQPIWSARHASSSTDVVWDILTGRVPEIPKGAVILHLAGVLRGDATALRANTAMALNVCKAAKKAGARHVFLASSAAVYGASSGNLVEVQAPSPRSDYGHAKLAMERNALCWAQSAGVDRPRVTCLRIGNVLGADALFGHLTGQKEIRLDPVPGAAGGPMRSYIGPQAFAGCIASLLTRVWLGTDVPPILNIASRNPVFMADLLTVARLPYRFGPPNKQVIAKVCLSTKRLETLVRLAQMTAADLVDDWKSSVACLS